MSSSILYQIQDAGGAGKCFFYSLHDSILSRENETTPQKQILNNIYRCFHIPKAAYDGKATIAEKKDQFNQDIRTYLASKIRENPSEFQRMAEADFKILYQEAQNKTIFEQTKRRGEQDINNYPGTFESLLNPITYAAMTADNELFELQAAGAVSVDAIRTMGKTEFYNLIANVLVANNYTTYALQPIIALLNYCLSKCPTQGYFVHILFPTSDLQREAKKQTLNRYGKDLLSIPVFKTHGAHYQAVVEQKVNPNPNQDLYITQAQIYKDFLSKLQQIQKGAQKDVDTILDSAKTKDPKLKTELDEIFKLEKYNKKNPDKQRKIQTESGTQMYSIPRTFFKINEWYSSIEESDGTPIVGPFIVTAIRLRDRYEYILDVTMVDGTKTQIKIDNRKGHFVSYKQISKPSDEKTKSPQKQVQITKEVIEERTINDFEKKLKELFLDDLDNYYLAKPRKNVSSQTLETIQTTMNSMDEFKKKTDYDKYKEKIDLSKREIKGGYRKRGGYKKTHKKSMKRGSKTRKQTKKAR